jgi:hypothetical protein
VSLTFVAGTAVDVFAGDLAAAVQSELSARYAFAPAHAGEPYRSEPVPPSGWRDLQTLVGSMLGAEAAPHVTKVDAYQAVYIPAPVAGIDQVQLPNAADPLQVSSLQALIVELEKFASQAQLPTGDLELMGLAADYLEADADRELDFQTYVQLMLSARQAVARKQALWIVT